MATPVWWGEYTFEAGQTRHWQLAGLDLQVRRSPWEWQIESYRHPQQHEDDHSWQILDSETELPEKTVLQRHIFNQTNDTLSLLPRLADRSVVIKPINPLFIPANQSATLFVSTPVWVTLAINGVNHPLLDIPVVRPTDTWFGSSPIRGELCYATKVFGRLDLDQLPVRAFRAVTPVHIVNHSADTMPIERINIPTSLLPLYSSTDGRLWTPTLEVERPNNGRAPKVRIDARLHTYAGVAQLVNHARQENQDNLIRLFEHLFE
jgi:hypothetical protein